ncbi:ParA family protein [Trichlorobacter ammonificans]|uniref:Chromosome (Plasmid) partitioning protein ParA n=1 Tax=Trichlorobacter ammonificans TaxID=2916410 RepID=A0ABM9D9G8_9BACT|nr:ParA family protein [Trichlorobacter ammonificans]CAH2031021.1 Chromosome (plasmid) partitioning protein ParA [Trichlorobacter ammonificans]
MKNFPYILTICSEKGGVGKTTLATNLAIYLKAMHDELPVTIMSFDNHFTIDRMFELKGQPMNGTVRELLTGTPGSHLLHPGQYGVRYIPSSNNLTELYQGFKGPMALCRMMAESGISGIVVLDTRPDLNILTQNALYAADRVLIPVKDMPSLENCKNIFALFDQRGIDKKSLSLIPCLIDSRIKYDGIFKDQRTLLRAFAINRGYRCLDTYISKSPKVESLNTNPEGKIYPILTHARGTEVHNQFVELGRDVLAGYHQTAEPRAYLYHQWLTEQEGKKKEAFLARLEGIAPHCVICGAKHDDISARGFYFETSDRASRGFLHSDCLTDMLCCALYNVTPDSQAFTLSLRVIRDTVRASTAVIVPVFGGENCRHLRFMQLDNDGNVLLERTISLEGFTEGMLDGIRDRLFVLLNETLLGYDGTLRTAWLSIHPVDEEHPEQILQDGPYRRVQEVNRLVTTALSEQL